LGAQNRNRTGHGSVNDAQPANAIPTDPPPAYYPPDAQFPAPAPTSAYDPAAEYRHRLDALAAQEAALFGAADDEQPPAYDAGTQEEDRRLIRERRAEIYERRAARRAGIGFESAQQEPDAGPAIAPVGGGTRSVEVRRASARAGLEEQHSQHLQRDSQDQGQER
jgi:hypothetical protein